MKCFIYSESVQIFLFTTLFSKKKGGGAGERGGEVECVCVWGGGGVQSGWAHKLWGRSRDEMAHIAGCI